MKFIMIRFLALILPFFFMVVSASDAVESNTVTLEDIFKELGIFLDGVKDFSVYKNVVKEGPYNTFQTIVASKHEQTIKIEITYNIDTQSAQEYIEEKQFAVQTLYRRVASPYPGMISKAIECPAEFFPERFSVTFENKEFPAYILGSTPRFTYGACVEELIRYKGVLAFIYSEGQKTLYRIELFIPKENFVKKEVLERIRSFTVRRRKEAGKDNTKPVAAAQPKRQKSIKQGNFKSSGEAWGNYKDYNLIIIGFDPLGANHVGGPYGYSRNTTPALLRFSKNSFLFKNAISPSSWTLPAFMSWFTSLYPSQHKITNKYSTYTEEKQVFSHLAEHSPSVRTLAQVLKQEEYRIVGFTGGAGVGSMFGYSLGFDTYYDKNNFTGFDVVLPMALDWIREHKKEKFFVFIQGYDVHGRHKLPQDFRSKFADPTYRGEYKGTPEEYWKLRERNLDQGYLDMRSEDVKFWRDWYDGKIYNADRRLGKFLKELEKLEITDKTIIVISSASGNEFYEHKRFDHGYSLYDELIHVPLVIKIPGMQGREIESQVRMIDIMPTVLQLFDIPYDETLRKQIQGVSLIPLMKGGDLQLDAFSETDYLFQSFKRSLRKSNGWKFIYSMETGERELYNLRDDPQELNNLIEEENEISYELEQELFTWLSSLGQGKYYFRKLLHDVLN